MTDPIRHDDLVREQLVQVPLRRSRELAGAVRAGTTGSGADLLVLTWTAADLERECSAGVRVLSAVGISAGMRVANTLPGALVTPGSLLLGDVIEALGGLDIPLGMIESEAAARQAWQLVDRVHPDVLCMEAASAVILFAAGAAVPRPWWKGIVWLCRGGVTPVSAPIPESLGFNGWQRHWLAVPEVTSFVAHSCAVSRFHFDAGVAAGSVDGVLVLTARHPHAARLRYDTGIPVRGVLNQCPCGISGTAIEME